MTSGLDDIYGVAIVPGDVDAWERETKPISLTELSTMTAEGVRTFFESALKGFPGAELIAAECKILWLAAESGTILIALEEVIQSDGRDMRTPRMRAADYPEIKRLGHPALVGGEAARIGGEITFDPDAKRWTIDNLSGRYGRSEFGRTEAHLAAAKGAFAEKGIPLDAQFI